MRCDCSNFRLQLFKLSRDILSKGEGEAQWTKFEEFVTNYTRNDDTFSTRQRINNDISRIQFRTFCSEIICSLIAFKLNVFKERSVNLSTLLLDLLTVTHLSICARRFTPYVWDFENTIFLSGDRETFRLFGAFQEYTVEFMEILLTFGFVKSPLCDSPLFIQVLKLAIACFAEILLLGVSKRESYEIANNTIELVKRSFFQYTEGECYKRMFWAVIAIHATQQNIATHNHKAQCLISNLRMYFAGTTDAFPSIFETRSVLYANLKLTGKLHLFDTYCEELQKLIPECPAKIEPRKLVHLTRCQVRENLRVSNLPLPSAVEKLFSSKLLLPMTLKNYLLGEDDECSKNKRHDSPQEAVTLMELATMVSDQPILLK